MTDDPRFSLHNFLYVAQHWDSNCFFLEKKNSGSPRDDKDQTHDLDSAPEIRDVFGDFDDEEEDMGYAAQQDIEQDSNVSVS